MAANIPEAFKDLFTKVAFAHLATIIPDGSPQVTPFWVDYDGSHVRVNSAKGRLKNKNMRRDKRVALSIPGSRKCLSLYRSPGRGQYLGEDRYPFRSAGEVRVIYKIRPDKVSTSA